MSCNVYDFDGTLYRGDSTADFVRFCLKRYPAVWLTLPGTGVMFLAHALKLCSLSRCKQYMYRFLRYIPDVDAAVAAFWDAHLQKVFAWYPPQRRDDDIVISASPFFLLRPACVRLGISHLIASRVDSRTGRVTGENCKGEEKVRRLQEEYPDCRITAFYSDGRSDAPLAALASQAYFVRRGVPEPWAQGLPGGAAGEKSVL